MLKPPRQAHGSMTTSRSRLPAHRSPSPPFPARRAWHFVAQPVDDENHRGDHQVDTAATNTVARMPRVGISTKPPAAQPITAPSVLVA